MEAVINNLDDLIFKDRNKNYGAYANRRNYSRYLFWALISASTLFLSGISIPLIANYVNGHKMDNSTRIIVMDTMITIDPNKVPPPEPPKPEPPKPEPTFTAPIPSPDTTQNFIDLPLLQDSARNKNPMDTSTYTGDTGTVKKVVIIEPEDPIPTVRWAPVMPEFPGGEEGRLKYLAENTVYPDAERHAEIQGTVYVSFIINEKGNVTNVELQRGVSPGLDEEALRVVKKMPKWSPGLQNGQAVRVAFSMQIKFRLE